MAFRACILSFSLLFLCFCCLSTSTVVDIRSDLPNQTQVQLVLSCDQGSSFNLKPGQHHSQTVGQDLECTAVWTPLFTTWDAYVAKRDKGHNTIYWSVRKDGFYRSWDGSKWKLVENWHSD